jgi:Cation transporting ATPase, C-terminus
MTNVFNVFTVMQIFNLFNARKIHDELNIFDGITRNWIFFAVFVGCFGGQAIIIEFGKSAMKVAYSGLPGEHWAIAIGLGASTLIAGTFCKLIPDSWCPAFGDKKKDPLVNEDKSVLSLRKKRSSSFLRQGSALNGKKESSI